jgi:hypothetical protein
MDLYPVLSSFVPTPTLGPVWGRDSRYRVVVKSNRSGRFHFEKNAPPGLSSRGTRSRNWGVFHARHQRASMATVDVKREHSPARTAAATTRGWTLHPFDSIERSIDCPDIGINPFWGGATRSARPTYPFPPTRERTQLCLQSRASRSRDRGFAESLKLTPVESGGVSCPHPRSPCRARRE